MARPTMRHTSFLFAITAVFAAATVISDPTTLVMVPATSSITPASALFDEQAPHTCRECDTIFKNCLNRCHHTKWCLVECNCLVFEDRSCNRNCGYANRCEPHSPPPLAIAQGAEWDDSISPTLVDAVPTPTTKVSHSLLVECPQCHDTFIDCMKSCHSPDRGACSAKCNDKVCAKPYCRDRCRYANKCSITSTLSFAIPPTTAPVVSPRDQVCISVYNTFAVCTKGCLTAPCQTKCYTDICYNPAVTSGRCPQEFCSSYPGPEQVCTDKSNTWVACTRECQDGKCHSVCDTKLCEYVPDSEKCENIRDTCKLVSPLNTTTTAVPATRLSVAATIKSNCTTTTQPAPDPSHPDSACYGCFKNIQFCKHGCRGDKLCEVKCECAACRDGYCHGYCGYNQCRWEKDLSEQLSDPADPNYWPCGKV